MFVHVRSGSRSQIAVRSGLPRYLLELWSMLSGFESLPPSQRQKALAARQVFRLRAAHGLAALGTNPFSQRPWSVVVSLEFPDEKDARRFERYLKSGSGRALAMATRHFG